MTESSDAGHDVSPRLRRRIERDYPGLGRADDVSRWVAEAADNERVQAAIVIAARGDLTELRRQLDLARLDWRDVLMNADLGHGGWQQRLDAELGRN